MVLSHLSECTIEDGGEKSKPRTKNFRYTCGYLSMVSAATGVIPATLAVISGHSIAHMNLVPLFERISKINVFNIGDFGWRYIVIVFVALHKLYCFQGDSNDISSSIRTFVTHLSKFGRV